MNPSLEILKEKYKKELTVSQHGIAENERVVVCTVHERMFTQYKI